MNVEMKFVIFSIMDLSVMKNSKMLNSALFIVHGGNVQSMITFQPMTAF